MYPTSPASVNKWMLLKRRRRFALTQTLFSHMSFCGILWMELQQNTGFSYHYKNTNRPHDQPTISETQALWFTEIPSLLEMFLKDGYQQVKVQHGNNYSFGLVICITPHEWLPVPENQQQNLTSSWRQCNKVTRCPHRSDVFFCCTGNKVLGFFFSLSSRYERV